MHGFYKISSCKKMIKAFFIFNFSLLIFNNSSFSQNAAARYEIDAKRIGVSPVDKDALPRSREFLRLDSTYYVGWMYEGMYKYDRSADYLGYKNAITPLRKAFDLIQKDFGGDFKNMYSDIVFLQQHANRYQDLLTIGEALKECYDNIEMPDSVMAVLDNIDEYHFKKDFFGVFYHRAWTYHRNRFFTSKDHPFLKNSIEENEKMAFQWCYNGFDFIEKNKADNDAWFGPEQAENDRHAIYHYLALLHCYNKNYDSSVYYYEKLAAEGGISWNNYGGMQSEIGNFANATDYFMKDQDKAFLPGMLREPYYYVPELYVYAGRTKDAINMTQGIITSSGSTPGFGWYNIALGRSYLYDGQLDSCEAALDKAANFKELHIGTTLTQNQYDFTINLLRVELADKKIEQVKFLNTGWWYSPMGLYNIATLKIEKMMAEYVVVNQLIFNPERDRLVYDLFCAESTTSFDEAWYMMKDFSPAFFTKKYEDYQHTDKRSNVQRYFQLFAAKFKWENGNKEEAKKDFENIDHNVLLDTGYEKLFIARLYESLAKAYINDGDKSKSQQYSNTLFEEYPQLIPFSGIKMQMKLSVSGVDDDATKKVISEIKSCSIDWVNDAADAPSAAISFEKKSGKYQATINVQSSNGKPIVQNQKLIFQNPGGAGSEIALRLFGKGGALVFEQPEQK